MPNFVTVTFPCGFSGCLYSSNLHGGRLLLSFFQAGCRQANVGSASNFTNK